MIAQMPDGRVIIEKPFGHDLHSAQELNRTITRYLDENQIYRIDHYLGKETVQNILTFRFGNSIFEPLFNQKYVEQIQITSRNPRNEENAAIITIKRVRCAIWCKTT